MRIGFMRRAEYDDEEHWYEPVTMLGTVYHISDWTPEDETVSTTKRRRFSLRRSKKTNKQPPEPTRTFGFGRVLDEQ